MKRNFAGFGTVLNCSLLSTYVRVIETGNISAAARSLYLAQSAVSSQLSALTRAVGVPLMERVHGRWETTAAGRIFYDRARQLLSLVEQLERDISDTTLGVSGHIVVASTRTVTDTLLPTILAGFSQRFPDIRVEVLAGNRSQAELWLSADEADVALVALPFGKKGLELQVFDRDELKLILPSSHVLASRESVSFSEIEGEQFILFEEGTGTRALLEEQLGSRFGNLDIRLSLNSNDALANAVRLGMGIAFLPARSAEQWASLGDLRALSVTDLDLFRDLAVVVRQGLSQTSATRAFVDFVRSLQK
ncbi:MAG: selenium metabolism-associated LysR family transcriptional regulator [Vulcanimicrobiaceae bacterium]